jgi:signal peptidase I
MSSALQHGEAAIHHHSLLQAFQSLLFIVVIALFVMTFTAQPFRIPSASMEPTLLVGDFLLVNKEVSSGRFPALASIDLIQRGDVIVFHYPVDPAKHLVKRIVGLPGDHLSLIDGHVLIDGHALNEPYAFFLPSAPDSYRDDFPQVDRADPAVDSRWWIQMHSLVANGELTIPPDSYFVLGDNRNDSEDSRYWGLVPRVAIVGKPFLIYFSLNDSASALNDSDPTPGQTSSGVLTADGTNRRHGLANSLFNFARWDRTLRILH